MIFNTRVQHFCTTIEAGSLHKAADLLHVTAGSISRSLQKLREDVGFDLFYLDGRKLVLTKQGLRFYQHCRGTMEESLQNIRAIQTLRTELEQELRIGTYEVFSTHFLSDILDQLSVTPRLTVHELIPGKIEEALLKDEIDYGITTIPVTTEGVAHLPIKKIEIGIYAAPGAFEKFDLRDLPFAVPCSPLGRNTAGASSLDGWNPVVFRRVRYRFEMLESALLAARKGLCAVYVPRFLGERPEFKLRVMQKAEKEIKPAKMQVYLVKRNDRLEDDAEKQLSRILRLKFRDH